MGGTFDPTRTLTDDAEIIRAVVARLEADADLVDVGLRGAGRIYAFRVPPPKLEAPLPDRFLVVRAVNVIGGRAEGTTGVDGFPFQVMSECSTSLYNVDAWHSSIHKRVRQLLVGWKPDLVAGRALLPVERTSRPSRPEYDGDTETLYSTADYRLLTAPA